MGRVLLVPAQEDGPPRGAQCPQAAEDWVGLVARLGQPAQPGIRVLQDQQGVQVLPERQVLPEPPAP